MPPRFQSALIRFAIALEPDAVNRLTAIQLSQTRLRDELGYQIQGRPANSTKR